MNDETLDLDPYVTREPDLLETQSRGNSGTDRRSGGLEVHCPNCHQRTHVAIDTALSEVTCRSCGSQFSLITENDGPQLTSALIKMGRFELVSRLGMGAFGSVWKARDNELDRMVAIKIPRRSAMTAEEQEHFFREARAAAQLSHPSIVSVHEVGREGDNIYIVSDFVRGVTLGDWLSGNKLTNREAAELCTKISDALHHAHEKGVVHRDLKPANIMIDADGQPHVMDFGLARREVGEVTITTDGQILGTPAYMSPEQARGEAHQADRRSDVYSLGAILFQMLTDELPFRGNPRMLLHQVVNDEPPSPRKLNANVPKDLETIIIKCLEKSPDRRYQSSEELADEFRRFIAGEPIRARPIGHLARSWRWAKRRPTAAALLALLILAAGGFATAFVRERDLRLEVASQKKEADLQRKDADDQRGIAEKRKAEAEDERDNARAVVSFLTDDVLAKASPKQMPDKAVRDTLVKNLIEPAAATVGQRFNGKPSVEAAVRNTLAETLDSLGRSDLALVHAQRALEQRRKVLGENHPDTITSLSNYASVLDSLGRAREAEPLFKQALEQNRKVLGDDHPETINSLNNYAGVLVSLGQVQGAEPLFKQALEQRRKVLGENDPATITSINNYAVALKSLGRVHEAEPLYKQALELHRKALGEDHPDTLTLLNNYAGVLKLLGRAQEAEPLYKQALEQHRKELGENHAETINSLDNYAYFLQSLDRAQEAEPLIKQALEQRRKVLGENHADTITSLNHYALVLESLGRFQEAEPLSKQVLEKCRNVLGENHPNTLASLNNYASMLKSLGRAQEAEPLYKQALEQSRKLLGENHPDTITSLNNYASVLRSLGRAQEAEPFYKQALDLHRKLLGEEHPDTIVLRNNYAYVLELLARAQEAESLYKQSLEQSRRLYGEYHSKTIEAMVNLARVSAKLGKVEVAAQINEHLLEKGRFVSALAIAKFNSDLLDRAITFANKRQGEETPEPMDALVLGQLRLISGNLAPAEAAIRTAIRGGTIDHSCGKSLGWCLFAQGKADDAGHEFETILTDRQKKDGTYNLDQADPDQLTAGYFRDLLNEQQYAERLAGNKEFACAAWFYIGQRREIEGKKDVAVAAYEKCVELGSGEKPQIARAFAQWRLMKLQRAAAGQK